MTDGSSQGFSTFAGESVGEGGEEVIEISSVMGGVKRRIFSKNFRGGRVTNFLGGVELDLTQADINGTAVINLLEVLSGLKLIVPAGWQVRSEVNNVLGGLEDKRNKSEVISDKTLVLTGTCILSGIEIKSY